MRRMELRWPWAVVGEKELMAAADLVKLQVELIRSFSAEAVAKKRTSEYVLHRIFCRHSSLKCHSLRVHVTRRA